MSKKEHMRKVRIVANSIQKAIIEKAESLYLSGGVDPTCYSDKEYVLARILVSVAMKHLADYNLPSKGQSKRDYLNLLHF